MFQQITLVGSLGKDPELKYSPQGTPITSFSMATNRKYQTADGQTHSETVWWRVSCFGKTAEAVNQYLTKGSPCLVVGTLTADASGNPRLWTDNEGKPRTSFEIRADTVRFLGAKKGESKELAKEDDSPPF